MTPLPVINVTPTTRVTHREWLRRDHDPPNKVAPVDDGPAPA